MLPLSGASWEVDQKSGEWWELESAYLLLGKCPAAYWDLTHSHQTQLLLQIDQS